MPLMGSVQQFEEQLERHGDKLVVAALFSEECYVCKSLHPVRVGGGIRVWPLMARQPVCNQATLLSAVSRRLLNVAPAPSLQKLQNHLLTLNTTSAPCHLHRSCTRSQRSWWVRLCL